jgi:hypothetical protein
MEGAKAFDGPVVGTGKNSPIRLTLGIRENTSLTGPIGADGDSATGDIWWVGASTKIGSAPQGKLISPDPEWQTVTFNPVSDSKLAFSGTGTLDGTYGVLEHLAFSSMGTNTGRYIVYIDNVTQDGVTIAGFEGLTSGAEALFRAPSFSGSTSANLLLPPNVAAVDATKADGTGQSLRVEFQFIDNLTTRWLRMTTSGVANYPNPEVLLNDANKPISLRMLLVGCQVPFADADKDGDVDQEDFGQFQLCYTGEASLSEQACACFDVPTSDGQGGTAPADQKINQADYLEFAKCITGPDVKFTTVQAQLPDCQQ